MPVNNQQGVATHPECTLIGRASPWEVATVNRKMNEDNGLTNQWQDGAETGP